MQPEVFEPLVSSLQIMFKGKQCTRSECGFTWAALFFKGCEKALFFCWNGSFPGLCLATERQISGLLTTENGIPPFTESMKKHLVRSSIVEVKRINKDRIICIDFSRRIGAGISKTRSLVCEFAGRRGGLLLLDESGCIIDNSRHDRTKGFISPEKRPGSLYSPPSSFHGDLVSTMQGPGLFFALESLPGIGKKLGSEVNRYWHLFPRNEWSGMLSMVMSHENSHSEGDRVRLQRIGKDLSLFPVLLGKNPALAGTVPEALEEFTIQPLSDERLRTIKARLLKEAGSMKRKLSSMRAGLKNQTDLAREAWKHKVAGELLLANYSRICRGSTSLTLPFWNGDHYEDLAISIDPALTIPQNAQVCFRKFKKQSSRRTGLDETIKAINEREDEVAEFEARVKETADLSEIARLKEEILSIERPPHIEKSPGTIRKYRFMDYQVIAGTNRKANRRVTFVIASQDDIWLHARGVPGGHVIIKTNKRERPVTSVLQFAASLAAYFSRSSEALKVDVDYTKRKYVRGIPGTTAEVTYSNARTIRVSPSLWKELVKES